MSRAKVPPAKAAPATGRPAVRYAIPTSSPVPLPWRPHPPPRNGRDLVDEDDGRGQEALIACLVISADSTDIHSIRLVSGASKVAILARSLSLRTPATTRSGLLKTSMALPRRKFSGNAAKEISSRPHRRLERAHRADR